MRLRLWAAACFFAAAACQAHPPIHWAQGGSRIDIPRARWTRGDWAIDLMPDGRVLANGDHLFTLDIAGRVFDRDNDPIALLEPDGRVVGKNDAPLGQIGLRNASPPAANVAWLSIDEGGQVVRFDPEGYPHADGVWQGCGPALRTCTLATHLIAVAETRSGRGARVGVGLGMGVGRGAGFGMFVSP